MITAESDTNRIVVAGQAGVSTPIAKPSNADTFRNRLACVLRRFCGTGPTKKGRSMPRPFPEQTKGTLPGHARLQIVEAAIETEWRAFAIL